MYADLKLSNIMWSKARNRWLLVDFGSAYPPMAGCVMPFNGTPAFGSARALLNGGSLLSLSVHAAIAWVMLTRTSGLCVRDDVESLVYVLYYCLHGGQLSWADLVARKRARGSAKYGALVAERDRAVGVWLGASHASPLQSAHACKYLLRIR